jgi:hypothetical protein
LSDLVAAKSHCIVRKDGGGIDLVKGVAVVSRVSGKQFEVRNTTPPPFAPLGSAVVLPLVIPTLLFVIKVTDGSPTGSGLAKVPLGIGEHSGTKGQVGTVQREPLS